MIRTFENKLIVWGARGGLPASGNDYSKFGHATCCVHLETENKNFVFDAGTGIAQLGQKIIANNAQLILFQVNSITKGVDAQAEVNVRLQESGISVQGQGKDIDTMVASAKAYINALNKLINKREKYKSGSIKFSSNIEPIDKHVI